MRRVVIVGAGATGVAAFAALVRHGIAAHVDVVDPHPPGRGHAFDAAHPALLCNTSAGIMSLRAEDPDDFVRHLRRSAPAPGRDSFVPRALFGEYARATYAAAVALHRSRGGGHRHVAARCVAVRRTGGGYRVLLAAGGPLVASDVLLCQGLSEPRVPDVLAPHVGTDSAFASPFPEPRLLGTLRPGSRVLVLGTRLTGIDAALLLCGAGHTVTMASPSGQLPAVRTRTGARTGLVSAADIRALDLTGPRLNRDIVALVRRASAAVSPYPLRRQVSTAGATTARLRAEIALAEQGRTAWQDVVCSFVDAANDALAPLDAAVRHTALERCSTLFSRYLAAFPLGNARRLLGHLDAGRLRITAGTPVDLRRGARWTATWPDATTGTFDAVVGAAGYHPPPLHADGTGLDLTGGSGRGEAPHVEPDLRIRLPRSAQPERIWLLGIPSAARVASINAIYPMAQQVARTCRAVVLAQPGAESPARSE